MEQKKYTKLKDLVGKSFNVKQVYGFKWKMWLQGENRMTVSDTYLEGHSKKWALETEHGELEVSDYQFGSMLASVFTGDGSVLVGRTFNVKSNGKEGMEIRYYINADYGQKQPAPKKDIVLEDIPDEAVDLSDIPF